MPVELLDTPSQLNIVRRTADFNAYEVFTNRLFNTSFWLGRVAEEEGSLLPADYQVMALNGILAAQFGFPALEGQVSRHARYRWKKSSVTPEHQAGVVGYMADLNSQAIPLKRELVEAIGKPELEAGVLNHLFIDFNLRPVTNFSGFDVATYLRVNGISGVRIMARERMGSTRRPICLPDLELNKNLAAALDGFTGHVAETTSTREYETVIFPEIKNVVNKFAPRDYPVFEDAA